MTKPTRALLLIDFFNPTGFDECPGLATAALAAARRVTNLKARSRQTRVIYVNDNFGSWSDEFRSLAQDCLTLPGDAGKLARLLKPEPGDWVVLKPRHSAFYGTPLEILLDESRIRSLILAGTTADSCVAMTAYDAHVRKFDLWVPRDCVASATPAITRATLEALRRVTDARIDPVGGGRKGARESRRP
jgi:nicotinamidase-related amidase